MLRVLERIQALCKSFWARNQIKMKFLQHFLSNCGVASVICLSSTLTCLLSHHRSTISKQKLQSSKERISEDIVVFSCVASVSSRSLDQDPIWTSCGRSSHGKRRIRRRNLAELHAPKTWKTYENFIEELHTGPWHIELLRECTQGWFRSNQQRTLTNRSSISWWMERNLNSTQVLRSIMCREQFSMTKALRGTAWNTSAAGLQVLRTRLGCSDLSKIGPNNNLLAVGCPTVVILAQSYLL